MDHLVVITKMIDLIQDKNELYNLDINCCVAKTLKDCIDYCFDSDQHNEKQFEIESVLDFLQDELNTSHWSEVPIKYRYCFTISSFVKGIILLKQSKNCNLEILQQCIKCLDLGLLLGAPLEKNADLLSESAKYLSQEINKYNNNFRRTNPESCNKRKLTDDFHEHFTEIKAEEIDVSWCPSVENFNNKYFTKQIPIKLTGCVNHWPAMTKWMDVNYLLQIAGERTVPIEIGSHYVDENWSQKLMTLNDFITQHYLSDSAEHIGYLAQHNLFEQISELKKDICIPEYCCLSNDYDKCEEPDINAWFGPKGTVSPLHYDPKNNLLVQVFGTKQLILFSPEDSSNLYPHDGKMLSNTAQVDPLAPDLDKYPEFLKTKMYKCLLGPGEMLYIPVKWWHHVTALEKSFSVSFWWQ